MSDQEAKSHEEIVAIAYNITKKMIKARKENLEYDEEEISESVVFTAG